MKVFLFSTLVLLSSLSLAFDRPPWAFGADAGVSRASYSGKGYTRYKIATDLGYSFHSQMEAQLGLYYRFGDPSKYADRGLQLALRVEPLKKRGLFIRPKLGYAFYNFKTTEQVFVPVYESSGRGPWGGLGLGYDLRLKNGNPNPVAFTVELAYEYHPRKRYKETLGGNTVYNGTHHDIGLNIGLRKEF